jgi:hypothetical protein
MGRGNCPKDQGGDPLFVSVHLFLDGHLPATLTCVTAVLAGRLPHKPVFNLFGSLLAVIIVFIGGYAFGRWITGADPAMLRILAQSERFRPRYDAAKQEIPAVEVR